MDFQAIISTLVWNKHVIKGYGGKEVIKDIAEFICLWAPSDGGNPIPVRIVVSKDLDGSLFNLLTTDLKMSVKEVVELYIARWSQEVTHREVREHLGMETQRQWSDHAIERTTPLIFALYSLTFIMASRLNDCNPLQAARSAWYNKSDLTFLDLLSAVRRVLRQHIFSRLWTADPILQKFPPSKELLEAMLRMAEAA